MVCSNLGEYFRDIYRPLMRLTRASIRPRHHSTAISVNLSMMALQENETTRNSPAIRPDRDTHVIGHLWHELRAHAGLHWTYAIRWRLG